MKLWTLFALCAWMWGCGRESAPPRAGPAPPQCGISQAGEGFAYVLFRVGCNGMLQPGRARPTVADGAVTLEFLSEMPGPRGAELVAAWPALGEPPWLGHRIRRITVLSGGSIRVEFRTPARDPARLFADPRLAGIVTEVGGGDARDAIDANDGPVVTRHDASIAYARSLGRTVRLLAFDRLYLVAFGGRTDAAAATGLAAGVGGDWVRMGAPGSRRSSRLTWEEVVGECEPGWPEAAGDSAADGRPSAAGTAPERNGTLRPTVSYREGDIAARQIAERVVSAGLRQGGVAAAVAGLTGSGGRLVVRPVAGDGALWTRGDVAAVVGVRAGPVHPCSLHAEALRELAGWRAGQGRGGGTVLPVGEAAAFAIGAATGRMR